MFPLTSPKRRMFLCQAAQHDPVRRHAYQTLEGIMAAFCLPVKSAADSRRGHSILGKQGTEEWERRGHNDEKRGRGDAPTTGSVGITTAWHAVAPVSAHARSS
jgi:hypothetical protein